MTIDDIQKEIIEEFVLFDDWMERYNYLIDIGNSLEPLDEKHKGNDYLIEGCQSKVWLYPELVDNKIYFRAESDAIITRGIVALLIRVLSGQTPEDIVNTKLFFIDEIGLEQNLSPTRSNGLLAMVKQMKLYAIAYNAKLKRVEDGN